MSRYTGPKFKISRREGVNLTGTTSKRLEEVLQNPPGGRARPRQRTAYGLRLRAKQRLRDQFGLTERALRRFLRRAQRMPGPTGLNLLRLLERRLDNVVYRGGFARTRPMARQLVSHGNVMVNGRRVNIASCLVNPGDVIELQPSAMEIPVVKEEMLTRGVAASCLERDGGRISILSAPRREDSDGDIREDLIVEYYAR